MQAPAIQAVIFDMDGILIDSEPVWQQAEYQVLQQLGMTVSREAIQQTTGLRIDQVVDFWLQRFPEVKVEPQYIADQIIAAVIAISAAMASPCLVLSMPQRLSQPRPESGPGHLFLLGYYRFRAWQTRHHRSLRCDTIGSGFSTR